MRAFFGNSSKRRIMLANSTLNPAAFFMPIGQMQTHFPGPRYLEEHAEKEERTDLTLRQI
jgi:hypothetical protein